MYTIVQFLGHIHGTGLHPTLDSHGNSYCQWNCVQVTTFAAIAILGSAIYGNVAISLDS